MKYCPSKPTGQLQPSWILEKWCLVCESWYALTSIGVLERCVFSWCQLNSGPGRQAASLRGIQCSLA